uniref:Uncharacterized protein n=1 Tax=Mustela putorius furo TaxID=9669 RepID=M3Y0R9_MUSPF
TATYWLGGPQRGLAPLPPQAEQNLVTRTRDEKGDGVRKRPRGSWPQPSPGTHDSCQRRTGRPGTPDPREKTKTKRPPPGDRWPEAGLGPPGVPPRPLVPRPWAAPAPPRPGVPQILATSCLAPPSSRSGVPGRSSLPHPSSEGSPSECSLSPPGSSQSFRSFRFCNLVSDAPFPLSTSLHTGLRIPFQNKRRLFSRGENEC